MSHRLRSNVAPRGALIGAAASDRTGIVHLGMGNFHRAHTAVFTAEAMAAAGGEWGIRGFASASDRVVAQMQQQDNLYTVLQLEKSGARAGLIDVHRNLGIASADPQEVVDAIAEPAHRIVTLTVSEAGYTRGSATGRLAVDSPVLSGELASTAPPKSTIGQIARGLERRAFSGDPVTILSCDNLQSAGDVTESVVTEYLHAINASEDVLRFVAESVTFPNGMVDRIVPATTQSHIAQVTNLLGIEDRTPVPAEDFTMWVLEDEFAAGRPAWDASGAVFTDEVEAYEMVKLRLLNGSHSLIAYLGVLSGAETIDAAWNLDYIRDAVLAGIERDYLPTITLPTGFDADDYISQLDARWANPLIGHPTTQVASDGSLKLLQRVPAPAMHHLQAGRTPHHLALCVAAWIACVAPPTGFVPPKLAGIIREPAAQALAEVTVGATTTGDHVERILDGGFFPASLAAEELFTTRVSELLSIIIADGARAAAVEATRTHH
jgi:fructuronate reductase